MNRPNEYKNEYAEIYRYEIDRVFGDILLEQIQSQEHQIYKISLGTPMVTNIKLEIKTLPPNHASKVDPSRRKKFFSLEFIPDYRHGVVFFDLVTFLRSADFRSYFTVEGEPKVRNQQENAPHIIHPATNGKSAFSISWFFLESEANYIVAVLKEIGQTVCACQGKIDSKKIKYLSGNLLSENPQIPTKKLVAPPIKDNLTQDVALTIEEKHIRNQRASPSFFRNGQYRHPETTYILEKIREKSAILLAKRDSSYVNDSQKEQILHDYAQAWSIILPDEVCRFIMSHQENDGFEFSLWHANLDPIYLRVWESNLKDQERVIGFGISILEADADMLWDKLAEDLKKISEEVGNYEFEVTHPNEHSTEDIGKATIILEMPIAFRQPEKIRNMFILIGNLLFEHGYRITKSPAISKDFDNPTGKLQAIAKKSIQPPKIKPSSDR